MSAIASGVALGAVVAVSTGSAALSVSKPSMTNFTPFRAKPLATVTVNGKFFTGAKTVKIGTLVAKFKVLSATKVTLTVPSTAKSGKVSITTAGGTATSAVALSVLSSAVVVGSATAGKTLFQNNCGTCHGATGMGGNGGPDLQGMPLAVTEAGVIKQVTNGGYGMPSFGSQFTKAQLDDLAAFVTTKIN